MTFGPTGAVALRGGYAGQAAPDPDARDPQTYPSILTGDLAGDDLPGFVNNGENSLEVLCLFESNALVEGFTIRAGNADENIERSDFIPPFPGAAAALLIEGGQPTLRNCRFVDCKSIIVGAGG